MRSFSSIAIGLSLVFGCLLLALFAELYYFLWWKKTIVRPGKLKEVEEVDNGTKGHLYLFCWKTSSSNALNSHEIVAESMNEPQDKDSLIPYGEEEIEAELMRLHNLSGPPRILFTIKEETKDDLESQISLRSSRSRSLSDVVFPIGTPLSSPPFFTPKLTPYNKDGFFLESVKSNESLYIAKASPPPKFKFLRDAEEKLYKKTLNEEALRVQKLNEALASKKMDEDANSCTTSLVRGHQLHHPLSAQVNPLPSPMAIKTKHRKLGAFLSTIDP